MTAENAKVTVVVIHRNDANTLPMALASLRLQRVPCEIILVDDGSDEAVDGVLGCFPDLNLTLVRTNAHVGRGASRARAIERVATRWVTFLDADDWYMPSKLERQLKAVDSESGCHAVSCDLFRVDSEQRLFGTRTYRPGRGTRQRRETPFAPTLYDTERARRVGFDSAYSVGEDRAFLDAFLEGADVVHVSEPLYAYTSVGTRRTPGEELRLRRAHLRHLSSTDSPFDAPLRAVVRETAAGVWSVLRPTGPRRTRLASKSDQDEQVRYLSALESLRHELWKYS